MERNKNVIVKKSCHSRKFLSGIFRVLSLCYYKKRVILNLIQDLQRLSLLFINSVRGRFQIKFGMTPLYNHAFTLIELLVVVLIIGILAAVAVPQYQKAVAKTRFIQLLTAGDSLVRAYHIYRLAHGEDPTSLDQFDVLPFDGEFTDNTHRVLGNEKIRCGFNGSLKEFICYYITDTKVPPWLYFFPENVAVGNDRKGKQVCRAQNIVTGTKHDFKESVCLSLGAIQSLSPIDYVLP